MTLQQFNILNPNHQENYLLLNGVCVASRETEVHCLLLFQLESYYVEIHFHNSYGENIYSRAFEDTNESSPYLQYLDLNCLN